MCGWALARFHIYMVRFGLRLFMCSRLHFFFFYQKHVNTAASARDLHHFQHPHIGPAMVLLVGLVYCSRDPQISLFSNFFIKNGSHDTIHTFKNYFVTVFSVFSFSINKFNPNGPYISHSCLVFFFVLEELIKTVNYI